MATDSSLRTWLLRWETNPTDVVIHLTALLKLPADVLTKPIRGGKNRATSEVLSKHRLQDTTLPSRLRELAEAIWSSDSVAQDTQDNTAAEQSEIVNHALPQRDIDDVKAALKCQQLLAAGHDRRAARSLTSLHQLADISDPKRSQS